jgi:hypothetical protein
MTTLGSPQAHGAVLRAIKKGLLPPIDKNTKCVDCGAPAKHYDHRDYNKPLIVEPVCQICNIRRGPGIPNNNAVPINLTMERRNIFLPDAQWNLLVSFAKKTGLSVSELIRRAIDDFLKKEKK